MQYYFFLCVVRSDAKSLIWIQRQILHEFPKSPIDRLVVGGGE